MNIEKSLMVNEVTCTSTKTFEIRKSWAEGNGLRTGLIIMLYPGIDGTNCGRMSDVSLNGLMQHVDEQGWGSVRIVNLFATVYKQKPLASELSVDDENIRYIKAIIEKEDLSKTDIVMATGCSLKTNIPTLKSKLMILEAIKKKGLKVQQFVTDYSYNLSPGTHVLYMHLHFSDLQWKREPYPIDEEITSIIEYLAYREGSKMKVDTTDKGLGKKVKDDNKK